MKQTFFKQVGFKQACFEQACLEQAALDNNRLQPRLLRLLAGLGLLLVAWLAIAPAAFASDICTRIVQPQAGLLAQRIASIACRENAQWYAPFIDEKGRLASMTVVEAENAPLSDHTTPAWKRVVDYWQGSGLLARMGGYPGAADCGYSSNSQYPLPGCRAFVVDQPWSAAFVSWVMARAGVPGFNASASHIDYVRDAYRSPETSPFRFADIDTEKAAPGDLMCYVRQAGNTYGFDGLRTFLSANNGAGLKMHCDIVIAANPGGDGHLYLVGGNVLQGVTLRMFALNRNGMIWGLPRGSSSGCAPDNPSLCNFSRQDWAVLLKLKPLEPIYVPESILPTRPAPAQCCVNCVVGSGVPRCPSPTEE